MSTAVTAPTSIPSKLQPSKSCIEEPALSEAEMEALLNQEENQHSEPS